MKKGIRLSKSVLAAVLAVSMMPTSVYAFSAKEIKKEQEEKKKIEPQYVNGTRVINLDEGIDLAIKNNSSLKSLADKVDLARSDKERIASSFNQSRPGTDDDFYLTDSYTARTLTNIDSLTSQIEDAKYKVVMTELSCETAVLNSFINIKNDENNLVLAQASYKLQQIELENAQAKHKLGVISDSDLTTVENTMEQSKKNIERLELTIKSDYVNLRNLLGLKVDEEFDIEYDSTFEPYELIGDLETYINGKVSTDPYLKGLESAAKSSKFQLNIFLSDGEVGSYEAKENSYKEAERTLAEQKKQMSAKIRATYNQLVQLEATNDELISALKEAENNLGVAKAQLEVGNITKLDYQKSEMAVTKAKSDIQKNIYSYDALKYSFENPYLLIG